MNLPSTQDYLKNFFEQLETYRNELGTWITKFMDGARKVVYENATTDELVGLLDTLTDILESYRPLVQFAYNYATNLKDIIAPKGSPDDILIGKRDSTFPFDAFEMALETQSIKELLTNLIYGYPDSWIQQIIKGFITQVIPDVIIGMKEWLQKFINDTNEVITFNNNPYNVVIDLKDLIATVDGAKPIYERSLRRLTLFKKKLTEN